MRKKKIFNSVVLMTIFIVWFNAYSAAETTKNNFFPRFLLCAMEVDDLRQDMDFDKEFKRIKEHNMNMVSAFWRIGGESQTEKNREKAERFFKKAEEYGIRSFITTNIYRYFEATPDMYVLNAKGTYNNEYRFPCRNNPKQKEVVIKHMEGVLEITDKYPSFLGLNYDDEPVLGWWSEDGLSCYCPICKEIFHKRTGIDTPAWNNKEVKKRYPKGIINDDDIWVRFNQFRSDTLLEHYSWAQYIVKAKNPKTINSTQVCGGPVMVVGIEYPKFWEPFDVISVHIYPENHPLLTVALATEMANRASKGRKDFWISVQGHDFPESLMKGEPSVVTPDVWREQVWLAVSGGAKGIGSFGAAGHHDWTPFTRAELTQEMKKIFGELGTYGSVLLQSKKIPAETAVLYSWSTEIFNQMYVDHPIEAWSQWHRMEEVIFSFLRANIPIDIIFEDDILEGRIEGYKNIILIDVDWLRKSVVKKLEGHIKRGNDIYLDKETEIDIPGAKRLDFAFNEWYKLCLDGKRDRRTIGPVIEDKVQKLKTIFREDMPVETESKDIVLRFLEGKGYKMLFAINDDMKWYHVDPGKTKGASKPRAEVDAAFTGGGVSENRERGIIKGGPRLASMRIKNSSLKIYDLREEKWLKPVETPEGLFIEKEIPSGDSIIFVLTEEINENLKNILKIDLETYREKK